MSVEFLKDHFKNFGLTEEELEVIQDLTKVVKIKKNEILAEAGRKNTCLAAIVEGSCCSVSIDDSGNEIIHDIFYERDQYFAFDYESYLQNKPLEVSIIANQDSILFTSDIQQIKNLYDRYPRIYHLEMKIIQQHFAKALSRIKMLQEKDPSAKLKILQNQLPGIFSHFSFSQIASYLGVHRNTIGRAMKKF